MNEGVLTKLLSDTSKNFPTIYGREVENALTEIELDEKWEDIFSAIEAVEGVNFIDYYLKLYLIFLNFRCL